MKKIKRIYSSVWPFRIGIYPLLVIGFLLILTYSCKKDEISPDTEKFKYVIGDNYLGGKIAYIFRVGDPGYVEGETHGLIAATSDQGASTQWYNGTYKITGANSTALGTGSANTTAIITSQGNTGTYAAKMCRDYAGGGHNDWYLPSKDELNKLYLNQVVIGGFTNNCYWSSTEIDNSVASGQYFHNGDQGGNSKAATCYVRAIRAF